MSDEILVTLIYCGGSRVQAGVNQQALRLARGATVADAAAAVASEHPNLAPLLDSCSWARNHTMASATDILSDADELALLPPVSGGASLDTLTDSPIDVDEVLTAVADPGVGATVLFLGTVRDHARGRKVQRLEYEAYPEMAGRVLGEIATGCEEAHPGCRVAIQHRHGRLEIGDVSVAIAASSAHRAAAFDACRQAIEDIKKDVPIWKKEVWTDGDEWVGWGS